MATYVKHTIDGVDVYTRSATSALGHGETKTLGSVSIDSKISNSTDYTATYTWAVRHLDSERNAGWVTLSSTPCVTDASSGQFLVAGTSNPSTPNKINLTFSAHNTAVRWESHTGENDALPMLGSEATIKVDIAWRDTHGGVTSGTQTKYFKFQFPTELQSEDPSWTFDLNDTANNDLPLE